MSLNKILALVILLNVSSSLAVIAIDFGSQFIKVGIVQHGKIPTVVLNEESSRKTPAVYYHKGDERLFGNAARAKMVKNRKNTYVFIRDLLGKTLDDPAVKKYKERFPYYNLTADSAGNLIFGGANSLYVEEVAAMILQNVLSLSTEHAETIISAVKIIVPAHFGMAERSAFIRVAKMAGISAPELVSDTACILTEYSISNRKSDVKEWQDLAVLDVGASNTILSIFSFRPENGTTPSKSIIKSIGFDPNFGAIDAVICLRDYLIDLFLAENPQIAREQLEKDDKFMGKIFIQSEKAMHVLSSSSKASIFVESIYAGINLKTTVEQKDFESRLVSGTSITSTLKNIFASQEQTMTNVSHVVFFGAGTRIPLLNSIVLGFGLNPMATLNTDESAATGGVYLLASQSSQFRVLPFSIKDVWTRKLTMVIEGRTTDVVSANHPLPFKKVIKLSKSLPSPFTLSMFGDNDLLMNVTVMHSPPLNGTFVSINLHVSVNSSGFLSLNKAEMKINQLKEVNETVPMENTTNTTKAENATTPNITYQIIQKNVSSSIPLEFTTEYFHFKGLDSNLVDFVIERMSFYNRADQLKQEKNKLRNDVESSCFSMKNNLEDAIYSQFLQENEKSAINLAISEAFEWLDIVSNSDPVEDYQKMSEKLQNASKGWNSRYSEYKERPKCRDTFAKLTHDCAEIVKILKNMRNEIDSGNLTYDKEFLTSEVIEKFENKSLLFNDWFHEQDTLQNKTAMNDDPVWLVKEFDKRVKILKGQADDLKRKFAAFVTTAKKLDKTDKKEDVSSEDSVVDEDKSTETPPEEEVVAEKNGTEEDLKDDYISEVTDDGENSAVDSAVDGEL